MLVDVFIGGPFFFQPSLSFLVYFSTAQTTHLIHHSIFFTATTYYLNPHYIFAVLHCALQSNKSNPNPSVASQSLRSKKMYKQLSTMYLRVVICPENSKVYNLAFPCILRLNCSKNWVGINRRLIDVRLTNKTSFIARAGHMHALNSHVT